MIFLNPLLGAAIGASAGAVSGALRDLGISNDFMKEFAAGFKTGCSALIYTCGLPRSLETTHKKLLFDVSD